MTEIERDRAFREGVRAKHGWKCYSCGLPQEHQERRTGRALSIHRLQAGAEYTEAICVPLCQTCHTRAHAASKQCKGEVPLATFAIVHIRLSLEEYRRLRAYVAEEDLTDDQAAIRLVLAALSARQA